MALLTVMIVIATSLLSFEMEGASVAAAPAGDRIDVAALVVTGYASTSGSPSDIGNIDNVFDGDLTTLHRSAGINPSFIQVSFVEGVTYKRFRVYPSNAFGDPAYRWRVETADSQSDLDGRSGSYRQAVPWTDTASDVFSEVTLSVPVTAKLVRLSVERLTDDNFVHTNEWELFGTSPFKVLDRPRGVAVDSASRTIVAESGADRIAVFNQAGGRVTTFGSTGTASGRFRSPWDVATDANDRIFVVERGNHRVQVLGRSGNFIRRWGGFGSGKRQFKSPEGIGFASGKVYVADTGNNRVLRFMADGTLDTSWGGDGIVGVTGSIKRDHTGFDQPTDVAVNPLTGKVFVADHGNHRLEVFNRKGTYERTYLAVYRPHALAFDRVGNLYIAGEDPNDAYPAFDGRIRLLEHGEGLISRHYTGGLDDIARVQGGVALRPDGRIVFSDVLGFRLVMASPSLDPPLDGLRIEGRGTQVTFRWNTAVASSGSVRIGPTRAGAPVFTDPRIAKNHEVIVDGLRPNSRLFYGVSFPDSFDGEQRFTPFDVLNTGASGGRTQFLRTKTAGVIYTDIQAGPGYTPMSSEVLASATSRLQRAAEFYWRNSRFRLWPDVEVITVDKDITTSSIDLFASVEADLSSVGRGPMDNFDAAWVTSTLAPGNFGGAGQLFGRLAGLATWTTQSDFVAIHEISHSFDSIYEANGLSKYAFNHGIWAIPNSIGHDFAVNGQILRNMRAVNFAATTDPFTKVRSAPDADGDSVPDKSPTGLTTPLSITEATLGSSTSSGDTDGDGLRDLGEATALPFHNTSLTATDSDTDGVPDGSDLNPAYRLTDRVVKGTPVIDGAIRAGGAWTRMTDGWGFSNDALVHDSNSFQDQVATYAAWDDDYLYLALTGPDTTTQLSVDGDADNRFLGPNNYILRLAGGSSFPSIRVNVGVPDLFRQIDDHGQFSEFFDTDPRFTLPYKGRPIFSAPGEGLDFPARLVTEADLVYERGGTGSASTWEVAIPWSNTTSFRGFNGKVMALAFDVGGDLLFETDYDARIRLVGQ